MSAPAPAHASAHDPACSPDDVHADRMTAGPAGELRWRARDWREMDDPGAIIGWDALARCAGEPNPFFESWFLLPALRAFDPDGHVKLLCLEVDGQLAGLAPVERGSRYYGRPLPHFGIWMHPNCMLGMPLVAMGHERSFWRHLLDWCDKATRTLFQLHLSTMPSGGAMHDALTHVLDEQRRPATTVLREERAIMRTDGSAQTYLARSLTGKKRKELRRQERRLGEEGELTRECLTDDRGIDGWIEEFLALEARGWKGEAGSALASDPRTRALFVSAMRGASRRGRLERRALRLDGSPIAMLASFVCPPGAFSFKTAYAEEHARFSPGVLLQIDNLSTIERPGIDFVDSCACPDHPMIDHLWRERRLTAHHNIALGGAMRRTAFRALALGETGKLPGGIA